MSFEIKDSKGRILLHMNRKGKLALSRFPDLTEEEINGLIELYCELDTQADLESVEKFLRFKEDNEKFCS
jgi:hypothetical protein